MSAQTIDEVIQQLDQQLDHCRRQGSRLGYFPALYRKVTLAVKAGIAQGVFEDGPRMERLDVLFANRYLDAAEQWQRGEQPSRAWQVAFQAAQSWPPVVLQHLLLGINAHINLDLGIAAVQTTPGPSLPTLRRDFDHINNILAGLLAGVKQELCAVWLLLRFYDRFAGNLEDVAINFSLNRARSAAWQVAEQLAPLDEARWDTEIDRIDRRVALLGQLIWKPPLRTRMILFAVRLGERGRVGEIIDLLM